MRPVLLLVHGWGFDAAFWQPLRCALRDFDSVAWDLGFCGRPARPPLPAGRPVIAVGHSFGFLWLLHHRPVAWRALVSINGFPRFTRCPDFPVGVARRLLDRMLARLADEPRAVYDEFMARCGATVGGEVALDKAALAAGLAALTDWDGRPQGSTVAVDLVLAGLNDPIAPPNLTEMAFAGRVVEWQSGGHLLPRQAPDWCAGRLRRLGDALSGKDG
jgi:pimeloyl-[acyl-carrier protein] methyl ester esterase